MYNNDYVILVDENGQPYIAHGVIGDTARKAWGSLSNTATTYLKKVKTKAGKWRYIYDPEELKNLGKKAWGSKAGRFIDDHDAGITEKIQAKYYSSKANKASKRGYNDDAVDYSLKASKYRKQSEDEYANSGLKKGVDVIKNAASTTLSSIRKDKNNAKEVEEPKYGNRPTSHQKNVTGSAKEGWNKRGEGLGTGSVMGNNSSTAPSMVSNKDARIPSSAKVSDEYIMQYAWNDGIDLRKFDAARDTMNNAQRTFNAAKSGQERSSAQRQYKEAKKEYERQRQLLINKINEYEARK